MYDFSHDFVLNDLDDFAVEKNDPGVGQGPARLKLFQPTLRWRRQRDLARPSEVRGFPSIRRHEPLRAHRAFAAGGLASHSIRKFSRKNADFLFET